MISKRNTFFNHRIVRKLFSNYPFQFFVIAPTSFNSPARLSDENIYAALRTIDLSSFAENRPESSVLSTPMKQLQFLLSTPYRSPSIPYRSPVPDRLLQTPTHGRTTNGTT